MSCAVTVSNNLLFVAIGFAEDGVVAGSQVLDVTGGQRLKVLGLGLADHGIGLA